MRVIRKGELVRIGLGVCGLLCTLGWSAVANAQQQKVITFDVPGDTGGTYPFALGPGNILTGYYCDNVTCHGFVRAENGVITAFDVSGDVNGSYPQSINARETITGFYCDAITCHGFWRTAAGDITTFDVQDAVQGTFAYNINPAGAIAGNYVDASGVSHGFVRTPDGTIATFDAPGAGSSSGQVHSPRSPMVSIQLGRSRDTTRIAAAGTTAIYALRTAQSSPSTFQAQSQTQASIKVP